MTDFDWDAPTVTLEERDETRTEVYVPTPKPLGREVHDAVEIFDREQLERVYYPTPQHLGDINPHA